MSSVTLSYGYWEFWENYDPPNQYFGNQKVVFDGDNKLIYIVPGQTDLNFKIDIYSNWKEWVQVRENAKYEAAFRTTGGDPVGSGLFAGDIYFTINGWKIVVQEQVVITGIIYDNDPTQSPFIVQSGGGLRNVVSNLAYAYNQTGIVPPTPQEIRAEMDANSTKLIDIKTVVDGLPDADEIWNYSIRTLTTSMTPQQFWDFLLSNAVTPGSAGEKLKQVLTTGNFLALK